MAPTVDMRDFSPVSRRDIVYVVFKYKLEMLIIFIASLVIALGYLLYVGPTYKAQTKILVLLGKEKTTAIDANTGRPNFVFTERGQNINNEIEILTDANLTYSVLPKLKAWLDARYRPPETIYQWVKKWSKDAWRWTKELARTPLYALGLSVKLTKEQRTVIAFHSALNVHHTEETDYIRLTFSWSNPQFAAFAANTYAEEYVKRRIEVYKSADTQKFYIDQIELLGKQLLDIEEELELFLEQTKISNFDVQIELNLRQISRLEEEFIDVEYMLSDLSFKLDQIIDTYENTSEWPEVSETSFMLPDLSALDKHYFDLQAKKNELLGTLTRESRAIVSLEEQIAKLRKQKIESLTNAIAPQIKSTETKRNMLAEELQRKRDVLRNLDQKSRKYKELVRSRKIIETNYVKYKEKAEDFRIARALTDRRITSVLITGPALPPAQPSAPWNSLVMGLAALLGLFLGFVYSTFAEYFDRSFQGRSDVESVLEVPLLVTIPDLEYGNV